MNYQIVIMSNQEILKIDDKFLGDDLEQTRRDLWSAYHTSSQNHGNYLLTIAIALLALISGWNLLVNNPILGYTASLVIFGGLIALNGWLMLRSYYWSIWSDNTLRITSKSIVKNFNDCNLKYKYYYMDDIPPCGAILHIAVKQSLLNLQSELEWTKNSVRKLAIKTGV
jgi:hypothetical protein